MIEIIVSILLLLGSVFVLIASIGFVRFKDIYSRIHAITKASSFGIMLLLLGIGIYSQSILVIFKSMLIIIFVFLTNPLGAHSIIKSFRSKNRN